MIGAWIVKTNHVHNWEFQGGRPCPYDDNINDCSQSVYVCAICGAEDYGEKGGPGYEECLHAAYFSLDDYEERYCPLQSEV